MTPETCRHGHVMTGTNLCVRRDGQRQCRECVNASGRRATDRARARRSAGPSSRATVNLAVRCAWGSCHEPHSPVSRYCDRHYFASRAPIHAEGGRRNALE